MFLAHAKYPEINDLKSGVECLRKQFYDLAFNAELEASHGRGKVIPIRQCYMRAKMYEDAAESCDKFLVDKDVRYFAAKLDELGLERYLVQIKDYICIEDICEVLNINTLLYIFGEENVFEHDDDDDC